MAIWQDSPSWTSFEDINNGEKFTKRLSAEDFNALAENIAFLYNNRGQWKGEYVNDSSYRIGDIVSYNGYIYLCIKDADGTHLPTDTQYWEMLGESGGSGGGGTGGNLYGIEITPTKETQTITPEGEYDGFDEVIVNPIPDEYIIPSGTQEIFDNGTYDVTDKKTVLVDVETNQDADAILDEIDDYLDIINGEKVGEKPFIVTFIGADGATLCTVSVQEGYDCEDPVTSGIISTPTKSETVYYKYTFSGWSEREGGAASVLALRKITADKTVYAAFSEEYNFIAQGYCGEESQIVWGLHSDNTLRFVGEGAFSNGDYRTYRSQVTTAIVGEGITSIGSAFNSFDALQDISLPNTLTTIGLYCFSHCDMLTSITIPASVNTIVQGAFSSSSITSAIFEETTGWQAEDNGLWFDISSEGLAKPSTAAQYLTTTYVENDWRRSGS